MQTTMIMQSHRHNRGSANVVAAFAMLFFTTWSHAALAPQPAAGDGWQLLSQAASSPAKEQAETSAPTPSLDVAAVVLTGATAATNSNLTLSIRPQDVNLRNALDRWLQTQGWQLAWSVGSDLPLEFNATFKGDFNSVLEQTMKATNHMSTPTRICRHTNNVIRVIARAANCKD